MIQYCCNAEPADAGDAWEYWREWSGKQVVTSSRKGASRMLGREALQSKRCARVIAFTRNGRVFELFEHESLMSAVRRVYAATDRSVSINRNSRFEYNRVWNILATADARGGKVYTHPLASCEVNEDAVVRYMIQYSSDAAPADSAVAWEYWCAWIGKQADTSFRTGEVRLLGHEPLRRKKVEYCEY